MTDLPVRKTLRLKGYDYSQGGRYYITFCVKDRHEMLGRIVRENHTLQECTFDVPHVELSEYGLLLQKTIEYVQQNNKTVSLGNYVIMPNHVHLIVCICDPSFEKSAVGRGIPDAPQSLSPDSHPTNAIIPKLISSIKRYTNKQNGFDMWQHSYHDHIIRDEEDYQRISRYIDENPATWEKDEFYVYGERF